MVNNWVVEDVFVRYADDMVILCKIRRSAERTLEHIVPFIETKLFLRVHKVKTKVAYVSKLKFLGYSYYKYKGKCHYGHNRTG